MELKDELSRLDAAVAAGTRVVYELDGVAYGRLAAWLGKLVPLGNLLSKFMREVLGNLDRETAQRVGSPRSLPKGS